MKAHTPRHRILLLHHPAPPPSGGLGRSRTSQFVGLKTQANGDADVLEKIITLTTIVLEELNAFDERIANSGFEHGHDQDPELFELAKKYGDLHAAAASVHTWIYNRTILDDFFAKGEAPLCPRFV